MAALEEAVVQAWNRQADIVNRLAGKITTDDLALTPADGETDIAFHLSHMHEVRYGWLNVISKSHVDGLGDVFTQEGETWVATRDLEVIRRELRLSGEAIGRAMAELLANPYAPGQAYEHPMDFFGHMVWHDGWHVGLIMLALRRNGRELPEEWEEENMWGIWRKEG